MADGKGPGPLVISDINKISLSISVFVLVFGLFSLIVRRRTFVGESLLAMGVGIILGSSSLRVISESSWSEEALDKFVFESTRFLIAVQVMIAGIELPGKYLYTELRSVLIALFVLMPIKWVLTGGIFWVVLGNMSFLDALIIAACVAPTDPVLANAICKGKYAEDNVPEHIRTLLSAESGANDGLGFPFLFLAYNLRVFSNTGAALTDWALSIILYQIVFSIVLGALIGMVALKVLRFCVARNWVDKPSLLLFGIAMGIFNLGFVGLLGSDDLLASFVAGSFIGWDDWYRHTEGLEELHTVIDEMMTYSFFIFFGAIFPFKELLHLYDAGILIGLAVAVMLFRRLPPILLLYPVIPRLETIGEAIFAGWFGPIGVSGLFYAYLVKEDERTPKFIKDRVVPLVSLMVLASVVTHGLSVSAMVFGGKLKRQITNEPEPKPGMGKGVKDEESRIGVSHPMQTTLPAGTVLTPPRSYDRNNDSSYDRQQQQDYPTMRQQQRDPYQQYTSTSGRSTAGRGTGSRSGSRSPPSGSDRSPPGSLGGGSSQHPYQGRSPPPRKSSIDDPRLRSGPRRPSRGS